MRIAIAGLVHEANTFVAERADLATWQRQGVLEADEIRRRHRGARTVAAGFLLLEEEADDVELVPIVHSMIMPTGISTHEAYTSLSDRIVDGIRAQGPWDAVLLDLHGAAVSEVERDADGALARRVREVVGADVPIGVTLDLHANVSELLVEVSSIITVYQTNPHIDAADRGLDCARLVARMVRERLRPNLALVRLPIAIDILCQSTDEGPMVPLMQQAREVEKRSDVLSVSLVEGFPYADVAEMGMCVLVTTVESSDAADELAHALAKSVWEAREDMIGLRLSPEDALREAAAEREGPVVVLDVGDNVGAGSPGDSTHLLHAARALGVRGVAMPLSDPAAVEACARAGVGGRVRISVGGHTDDAHGDPFAIDGEVIALHDGVFEDHSPTHLGQTTFDVGASAGVRTDDGILIALSSYRTGTFSRVQFSIVGIDPERTPIVIAKGVHSPRAAFEPIASRLIWADTPGATRSDITALSYEHRPRPAFPFETDARWS